MSPSFTIRQLPLLCWAARSNGRFKEMDNSVYGSIIAELSVLYEISSLSFSNSEKDFAEEAAEKAARLFGARRFALFVDSKDNQRLLVSWGFRNPNDIPKYIEHNKPNQFYCVLGDELGALFTEQDHPIENRERRLYNIFAQRLENALVTAKYIAEQERSQENLRESEARFRTLVELSPIGISLINPDGKYKYVNPKFTEIFGYTLQDIPNGKEWFRQAYPDPKYRQRVISTWLQGLRKYQPGESMSATFTVTCKDGAQKIIQFLGVFLPNRRHLVTYMDITDLKRAEEELKQSSQKLQRTLENTIQTIALITEMRDPHIAGHQHRVTQLACAIAKEMGLPEEKIDGIRVAGSLHDIGKIGVPAEILSKPGKLAEIEFNLIKAHPQIGYDILKQIDFPWPIAKIVLQHHEELDGSGYPQGFSSKISFKKQES